MLVWFFTFNNVSVIIIYDIYNILYIINTLQINKSTIIIYSFFKYLQFYSIRYFAVDARRWIQSQEYLDIWCMETIIVQVSQNLHILIVTDGWNTY